MGRSTPAFPVLYFPELAQTHVHQAGDAIQPSVLCCRLLLLPSVFASIRVFSNESALCITWPKYWSECVTHCFRISRISAITFSESVCELERSAQVVFSASHLVNLDFQIMYRAIWYSDMMRGQRGRKRNKAAERKNGSKNCCLFWGNVPTLVAGWKASFIYRNVYFSQ